MRTSGIYFRTSIAVSSLVRLEAQGNYTRLYYANGKTELSARTLGVFEGRLPGFVRISRHDLVNPDYVTRIDQLTSQVAQVTVGRQRLRVPRRRIKTIISRLCPEGAVCGGSAA